MSQTPSLRLRLLVALAGAALLLGVFAATGLAAEYGGLGALGVFKAGRNGGHLEVNPSNGVHVRSASPADGSSYIAETIEVGGKPYFRIQKLGSKGEYLAEARVKLTSRVISWTASRSTLKSSGFTCWWWANARPKKNIPCSILKRLWRPSSMRSRP